MATGPDAPATRRARRDDGADEGRPTTDRGDDAHGRGAQAQVIEGEQEERGPEDAPPGREERLGDRERPQGPVVANESEPVADLVEDGLAILDLRWRRLHVADAHEQDRRHDVRHGVDQDRDRAGHGLDEDPAQPESRELRDRTTGREGAVGLHEPLALDHGRQVGVVRRVEERGEDRGQRRDHRVAARTRAPRTRTRAGSTRAAPPGRGRPRSAPAGVGVDRPKHPPRAPRPAWRQGPCRAAPRPRSGPRRASGSPGAAGRSA